MKRIFLAAIVVAFSAWYAFGASGVADGIGVGVGDGVIGNPVLIPSSGGGGVATGDIDMDGKRITGVDAITTTNLSVVGDLSVGGAFTQTDAASDSSFLGNLGIGTASPTNTIDVIGTASVSGTLYANGGVATNFGVGTATPSSHLEVKGGFNGTLRIRERDSIASYGVAVIAQDNIQQLFDAFQVAESGSATATDTTAARWIKNSDSLYLQRGAGLTPGGSFTSSGEVIRYDLLTGNVGIGTANPLSRFCVESIPPQMTLTNPAAGGVSIDAYGADSYRWRLTMDKNEFKVRDLNQSVDSFSVQTNAGDNTLVVATGGNVGIGTASPAYLLDVAGNIGIDEYIFHNGDGNTAVSFGDDVVKVTAGNLELARFQETTQNSIVMNDPGNDVDFQVAAIGNAYAVFVQGSDGNVGIGTASPTNTLDVIGDTFISGKLIFGGKAGTNLVCEHLFVGGTNYFGLYMNGAATTNLYPVLL